MKKKILAILLVAVALFTMLPITSSAASTVSGMVDLTGLNNDTFGNGYTWDNLDCILTLNSVDINTTDAIGIKLPANSTVIINGNNKISAASYGIHCLGAVTFKGDGTLTVNAAVCGITGMAPREVDGVVFRSGTLNINGAKTGIYTESSEMVFSGAKVNIKASEYSLSGKNIKIVSGELMLEGTVKAKNAFSVSNTAVTIYGTKEKAIEAGISVSFTDVKIKAGDSLSTLQSVTEYNEARKAVKLEPTKKELKKGFLFGGKLPAFVDYIVLTLIILGAAAVIIVPIIIKRKKTAKLVAEFEAAKKKKTKK